MIVIIDLSFLTGFFVCLEGEVRSTADSYRYSFEGYVPVDLPSSFDSEFGYIRYRVCIALEIPGQQNEQFEKTLTVIKKVDLNDRINIATHVIVQNSFRVVYLFVFVNFFKITETFTDFFAGAKDIDKEIAPLLFAVFLLLQSKSIRNHSPNPSWWIRSESDNKFFN